jgi:hypothetical protein
MRRVENPILSRRRDQHDGRTLDIGQYLQDALNFRVLPSVRIADVTADTVDVIIHPLVDHHMTPIRP